MKTEVYIRNLLFILLTLYFAQGSLYASGTLISQSILALVIVISTIYFFKQFFLKTKKPLFYKAWTLLLILNVFGFIFTGSLKDPIHFSMFKGILISLLIFYPFYYFAYKELLNSKILIQFFVIIFPVTIFQFFTNEQNLLIELNSDSVVNNFAYAFVGLIPFAFFFRNKLLAYGAIVILMFFIITGAKRGALVAGALGLLLFMYFQLRIISKKNRWTGYAVSLFFIVALSYVTINFLESNEFLINRLESLREGNISGRDQIYATIFNTWYNDDSVTHFLFGYGFAGSTVLSGGGLVAHNDWLELLSNFGLLGVGIYLFFFYTGFSSIRNATWNVNRKIIMLTILSIWFLTTLFSMGYTSDLGYIRAILIAFLLGGSKDIVLSKKNENFITN